MARVGTDAVRSTPWSICSFLALAATRAALRLTFLAEPSPNSLCLPLTVVLSVHDLDPPLATTRYRPSPSRYRPVLSRLLRTVAVVSVRELPLIYGHITPNHVGVWRSLADCNEAVNNTNERSAASSDCPSAAEAPALLRVNGLRGPL